MRANPQKEAFATLPGSQRIQYWDKEKSTVKIQAIACRTGTGIGFSSQLDCWVGKIVDVYPYPTPPRIRINSFGGSKTLGA